MYMYKNLSHVSAMLISLLTSVKYSLGLGSATLVVSSSIYSQLPNWYSKSSTTCHILVYLTVHVLSYEIPTDYTKYPTLSLP